MSEPGRPPFPISTLRTVLTRLRPPWDWYRGDARDSGSDEKEEALTREKLRIQVEVIQRAFDGEAVSASHDGSRRAEDPADTAYLFRPGHAMVRDEEAFRRLEEFFGQRSERYNGTLERARDRSPDTGFLVRLPSRRDDGDDVLETLDEIDEVFAPSREEDPEGYREYVEHPLVTPDHVIYVTYTKGGFCPATEPEMVGQGTPWPPVNPDENAGKDIRVSVVDTGLWKEAVTSSDTTWMDGVGCDPEDEEFVNPHAIHPYAGHGTFVSGVVQCLAPGSVVDVEGALTHGGAIHESEICDQIQEALDSREHPQLISISAGTHTRNHMALLGFEMLAARNGWDDGEATMVIAAAGNDASDKPFWPAAFRWVVGVGSVDSDGKQSDYSNFGDWVNVYARGRDLVNAFPHGTYTCYEPPHKGEVRHFKGMAQWSGTSFSTPVVTGLIAARMSATGEDARTAASEIINSAKVLNGVPVVGPLT